MKLSIVVPAYNVDRYIARCLKSLSTQSARSKFEVIVVDDGSSDGTRGIAEQIAVHDRNIRVVSRANHGLGASRNFGLGCSRGEYVWFVDGDDWIPAGGMEGVVRALQSESPDVLAVDFSCADERGNAIQWVRSPFGSDAGRTMRGAEFFARYHATTYAWIYIIRRSLLAEHGLRFQPRINMQDAEFIPRLLAVADSVHVSGIDAYVYVKREGSFINSFDPEVREFYFQSVLEVRRRLNHFRHSVSDALMDQGLSSKLAGIRRILLMAFVYDRLGRERLRARLGLLRKEGVYPFAPLANETIKDGLIRRAVNMAPILFLSVYGWLRERAAIRGVLRACRMSEA